MIFLSTLSLSLSLFFATIIDNMTSIADSMNCSIVQFSCKTITPNAKVTITCAFCIAVAIATLLYLIAKIEQ